MSNLKVYLKRKSDNNLYIGMADWADKSNMDNRKEHLKVDHLLPNQ